MSDSDDSPFSEEEGEDITREDDDDDDEEEEEEDEDDYDEEDDFEDERQRKKRRRHTGFILEEAGLWCLKVKALFGLYSSKFLVISFVSALF